MANRYLMATGNWNGPVWAATSDGVAGSAATPTVDDWVYIQNNYTVTLTADAVCNLLYHTNGTVSLGSSKLTVNGGSLSSLGSSPRTFNLGNGTLHIKSTIFGNISFTGSNLTIIPGSSLVIIDADYTGSPFDTLSKTFNDVIINMSGYNTSFAITGSPTFRSLTINSKNMPNTVNFDSGATITTNKLVAIGSSSSNKLTIKPSSGSSTIALSSGVSSYGQFVNMQVSASGAGVPKYIGSSSTQGSGMDWLLQDPPKISTLVDPLTTDPGSNQNWTVSGTVTKVTTGHDGGGYQLASGAKLTSTDTFDLLSSTLNFQTLASSSLKFNIWGYSHSLAANKFYRLSLSGTTYLLQNSDDGASWTNVTSNTVDPNSYRSLRLEFEGAGTIGTVNTSFNQSPTTALSSPANNVSLTTTTPTLAFTATDPEGEDVSYQVQVGNADFSTLHMDVTTTTYASGTQQTRVVSPALTQGGIDYYWRVRAEDPSGSNTYGAWSAIRTFRIVDSSSNFLVFFYP